MRLRSTVEGPLGKMLKNCGPIRKVPVFSFKVSNPSYGVLGQLGGPCKGIGSHLKKDKGWCSYSKKVTGFGPEVMETGQPSDPAAPIFVGGLSTAVQSRVVTPASIPGGCLLQYF